MKTPYETMFLLPPATAETQVDEFTGRLKESIEKKHGEITQIQKMGVRKTAYQVNKMDSAYYVLFQYKGSGETLNEVERLLKNSDEVLKFLSTKITTKAPMAPKVKPVKPGGEGSSAELKSREIGANLESETGTKE